LGLNNEADVVVISATALVTADTAGNWTATDATQNNSALANGVINVTNDNDVSVALATGAFGWTIDATGNTAASMLIGSSLADSITGGAGNDTITGGDGNDSLNGGDGNDVFKFASAAELAGDATVIGGADYDYIQMTAETSLVDANFNYVTNVDALILTGGGSVELGYVAQNAGINLVILEGGDTTITMDEYWDESRSITIDASAMANDITVTGLRSGLTVANGFLGTGDLSITTENATQTITLGTTTSLSTVTINADELVDGKVLTLTGTDEATVTLTNGDLSAAAYVGNLTVTATTGSNVITTGSGNDTITGGAGADTINVGTGIDTVVIGTVVNAGIDVITGFTNDDTISFVRAASYVRDPNNLDGFDTLDLALADVVFGWGGNPQPAAMGFTYRGNTYVVVDGNSSRSYEAGSDGVAQLIGTDLATLSAANFVA
jgi:hypothetical protein